MKRFALVCLALGWLGCQPICGAEKRSDNSDKTGKDSAELGAEFTNASAARATEQLRRAVQSARESYLRSLKFARSGAVSAKNVDEVASIDSVLQDGKVVTDFDTKSAKQARESFESSLKRAAKIYVAALKSALRELLNASDTSEAKQAQALIDAVGETVEDASGIDRRVVVMAKKDWQDSEIVVKQGATVSLVANGTWSAGEYKEKDNGTEEAIFADADTYNFQVRVKDGKSVAKGGNEWKFTATDDGELQFRQVPSVKTKRKDADGSITVRVKVDMSKSKKFVDIETLLNRFVPAVPAEKAENGKEGSGEEKKKTDATETPADADGKDAPSAKEESSSEAAPETTRRLDLPAGAEWRDTLLRVKKGDKVEIEAEGTWSAGVTGKAADGGETKLLYKDADGYNIEAAVEDVDAGRGGKSWSFAAPRDGVLYLRMAEIEGEAAAKPEGALGVTITVRPQ